jgi:hypothetical protein
MGVHFIYVIPFAISPVLNLGRTRERTLLEGLSFDGSHEQFRPLIASTRNPHLCDPQAVAIVDCPLLVSGVLQRIRAERGDAAVESLSKRLAASDCDPENSVLGPEIYQDHPLEMFVEAGDCTRLIVLSCVLAGAQSFCFHAPIQAECEIAEDGAPTYKCVATTDDPHRVWSPPWLNRGDPILAAAAGFSQDLGGMLEIKVVRRYVELLEPFFRPAFWHAGRLAVALGALWAGLISGSTVQKYLSLITVLESLLSTDRDEISHQVAERLAIMLEEDPESRYRIYLRMKQLYATRSNLVHGGVDNSSGEIIFNRLRFDARMGIVPDADLADASALVLRLVRNVVLAPGLLRLISNTGPGKSQKPLREYYLRRCFGSRDALPG